MRIIRLAIALLLGLAAMSAHAAAPQGARPVRVSIIAFNDFHGALEPPHYAVAATGPDGAALRVPAGGAAWFASAVARLRAANPNHVVVSAGDLISASPLVSAAFLDEPTILAMNMIGLDYDAVGNHEFDRGRAELLRIAEWRLRAATRSAQPCRLDRFPGAHFRYLAANVRTENGDTLFPPYAIRSFGRGRSRVRIGFIGLTLARHCNPGHAHGRCGPDLRRRGRQHQRPGPAAARRRRRCDRGADPPGGVDRGRL